MKSLIVGSISGIFNQLLDFNQTILGRASYLDDGYLDLNSWFWSEQFKLEHVQQCLENLNEIAYEIPIKLQWAMQNPSEFLFEFEYAKKTISTELTDPQQLYRCLELLQIACEIFYHVETAPFRLDVSHGFIRSSDSARELKEGCTKMYSNPYLVFIQNKIAPILKENCPDILWLTGRPNILTFAIAVFTRRLLPNAYIGITYHSSEYYSLNKITPLLSKNHDLFSVFDVIILYDEINTMKAVEHALEERNELSCVPNILYTPDFGKSIVFTNINISETYSYRNILNERPLAVKLFPQNQCYWNRCSFCGINNKYFSSSSNWNCSFAFNLLHFLQKKGIKRIWLLDEAIPPFILEKISQKILKENWEFEWHVRTRIEATLVDKKLCKQLKKSGLKSILLGFESASERILKLMNKTDNCETYIELAEKIVSEFNKNDISVHFPSIIGFPTETNAERERTLSFLQYLRTNYSKFSYNINVLELDISSKLYKNFAKYGISSLYYPCDPAYFIGNCIDWGVCDKKRLREVQERGMRAQFKWYPNDSLLEISSFYQLLEHTRIVFWSGELYEKSVSYIMDLITCEMKLNKSTILFMSKQDEYVLFNIDNLDYVKGGDLLKKVYSLKNWTSCECFISDFPLEVHKYILNSIQKLINYNILEIRR